MKVKKEDGNENENWKKEKRETKNRKKLKYKRNQDNGKTERWITIKSKRKYFRNNK